MGLDIFFHKAKNVRKSSFEPIKSVSEYNKLDNENAVKSFNKFKEKTLAEMKPLSGDEYKEYYDKLFGERMADFTQYGFKYAKMRDSLHTYDEVVEFFDNFLKSYYSENFVNFRKINFLYAYFSDRLESESCVVFKADLEDIIERCHKVLACRVAFGNKSIELAKVLLPTCDGFFFGGTEYDEYYFYDVIYVRDKLKEFLDDFDEEHDIFYVIMDW